MRQPRYRAPGAYRAGSRTARAGRSPGSRSQRQRQRRPTTTTKQVAGSVATAEVARTCSAGPARVHARCDKRRYATHGTLRADRRSLTRLTERSIDCADQGTCVCSLSCEERVDQRSTPSRLLSTQRSRSKIAYSSAAPCGVIVVTGVVQPLRWRCRAGSARRFPQCRTHCPRRPSCASGTPANRRCQQRFVRVERGGHVRARLQQ